MRTFALFLSAARLAMSNKFERFFWLARNVGVKKKSLANLRPNTNTRLARDLSLFESGMTRVVSV